MTKAEAIEITGGLSRPSKMPGKAFSIPAARCITGSKLRSIPDSVCSVCYACKGRYVFPTVQRALERRYQKLMAVLQAGIDSDPWSEWLDAMQTLIGTDRHFRFHDSGDLQSLCHIRLYATLANRLPNTLFWLHSKEVNMLARYQESLQRGESVLALNLTIRISQHYLDHRGPTPRPKFGWCESAVWTRDYLEGYRHTGPHSWYHLCPAPQQGNSCGDCRACWDSKVPLVVYLKH